MDRINKWIALGANVGVLLGLLLVFFEMRQNADLTRIAPTPAIAPEPAAITP